MTEATVRQFSVNRTSDWQRVANYLFEAAAASPLKEPEAQRYSQTEAEAWQRTMRLIEDGRINEATRCSAAIIYKSAILISLVMTVEPQGMHLSMVRIIPGGKTKQLTTALTSEIVKHLLGQAVERNEGVIPGVRHFYRLIR